jgi:metal-dependent amidase/aminoacylase/carboxypeptidase family protein
MTEDVVSFRPSMVAYGIDFMFHGKAAHAASNPHTGINALDAVIQTFNNVGMLRQQVRSEARIHGVVTSGGGAPNVIPPFAACRFRIRSYDPVYAAELKERVINCASGAATATGTRLEWKEYIKPYQSYVANHAIGDVMKENLVALGRDVREDRSQEGGGSTDFGNVSHEVPSVYAYLAICGEDAGWHSKEVAVATKTERGHETLLVGAKLMAMTAIDLLTNGDTLPSAKREHETAMQPIREGLARVAAASGA